MAGCSSEQDSSRGVEQDTNWPGNLVPPIRGATFPLAREYNPGAARQKRGGAHQGFDFSVRNAGRILSQSEPVIAVADGEILRIDRGYEEPSAETLEYWGSTADRPGHAGAWARDALLGRQVWIRHEDGHVSRYGHLSEVSPELAPGDAVEQGQPVGLIGTSGLLPGANHPAATPFLHYELWSADASMHLGQGLEPLEMHRLLAELFSESALPRYTRQILAEAASGQEPSAPYPPGDLDSTGFSADMPESITAGAAFTIPIRWQAAEFETGALIVGLDGSPMGLIEADGGAIAVGAIPVDADRQEVTVALGGVDQFGQTLTGSRTVPVVAPASDAAPLEVDASIIEAHTESNRKQELERLREAARISLEEHTPAWDQPFRPPVDGEIVGEFGQKLFHGMLRPQHPLPGVLALPTGDGTVKASNDGIVAMVADLPIRGRTVAISHGGGIVSIYARLDGVEVSENDRVQRGESIGRLAGSGDVQDRVLLWEIHAAGIPTDPRGWLNRALPQP
jgi:murein DD-endopeptidase MepM/ murein hydrolase activator NlpD